MSTGTGRGRRCRQQGRVRCAGPLLGLATVLVAARPLAAQGFFEQFSYEGLRLSGVGVEAGVVVSDRLTTEFSPGLRLDFGVIAPHIRVLVGASYFQGAFKPAEIRRFENRLRSVVIDPTPDFRIDVGRITWSDVESDLDLQYMIPAGVITPYLGLGLGVHIRNANGAAINGTFVEDALDAIGAGVNLSLGAAAMVGHGWSLTTEVRGGLASELRTVGVRGGFMYRFPPPRR